MNQEAIPILLSSCLGRTLGGKEEVKIFMADKRRDET